MPIFKIDPMPEMVSQTFFNIDFWGWHIPVIDPTCGRYCLKALFKYFYEKDFGVRTRDVQLPNAPTTWKNRCEFDPHDDFVHGPKMLLERDDKPDTLRGWTDILIDRGPIILRGYLGRATRVRHFVLLVGVDSDKGEFIYKDPLVGDAEQTEAFATMQQKIELPFVVAKPDIAHYLREFQPSFIPALAFLD